MDRLTRQVKRLPHTIRKAPQKGLSAIKWLIRRIPLILGLAALVLIGRYALELLYQFGWSGLATYVNVKGEIEPAKTLWDWMELLIVPLILAIGGIAINVTIQRTEQSKREQQAKIEQERREQHAKIEREIRERQAQTEREIADDRVKEQRLQNYFDCMAELLLEHQLSKPDVSDEVRDVARARTLTALRSLDGERKGLLIKFLYEADLILENMVVPLESADISKAHLKEANLEGANLIGANLEGANLEGVYLPGAHLDWANLEGANLDWAILTGAHLTRTNLERANLTGAHLTGANLMRASLKRVNLSMASSERVSLMEANLMGANLVGANLEEANLEGTNLIRASLVVAHLTGVNLMRANLRGANLMGSYLIGANLEETDLKRANLNSAKFDENTTLPDGSKWTSDTDMRRFTDFQHPDFWRSDKEYSPAYRGKDDSE